MLLNDLAVYGKKILCDPFIKGFHRFYETFRSCFRAKGQENLLVSVAWNIN
jgi:hypothetical protein